MAAPAAIDAVTYRDTAEVDAECALVAGAPFAADVHDRGIAGHRRVGDGEPALRLARGVRRAPSPTRSPPSTAPSSSAACCSRSTRPDLAMERHTLFADRPLAEFLGVGRARRSTRSTARSTASTRPTSGSTCAGATTRGRTPATCRSTTSCRCSTRPRSARWCISMANSRHAHEYRCFERRPLPDEHGARRRRDRHDEQLRRASGGRRRPARAASRSAVGDPRRVIAGTDCGFDTSAGIGDVAPSVVWELRALRTGADRRTAVAAAGGRGRRDPFRRRGGSQVRWRAPNVQCVLVSTGSADRAD